MSVNNSFFVAKKVKKGLDQKKLSLNYKQQQIKTIIVIRQAKVIYYEHVNTVNPH